MNQVTVFFLMVLMNLPILIFAIRGKHLSIPYGVLAAAIVGIALFLAHWLLWVALAVFFATSSLLTKYKESSVEKAHVKKVFDKGGERDSAQVFANGGVALLVSIYLLFHYVEFWKVPVTSSFFLYGISALAVVTADTWSTELGVLSKQLPHYILKPWETVDRGTSGGVTLQGTLAGIMGAFLIALIPALSALSSIITSFQIIGVITLAGFLGNTLDSILGATVQAMYYCDTCKTVTERKLHTCGQKTRKIKGLSLINNDMVNFLAALLGGSIVFLFF